MLALKLIGKQSGKQSGKKSGGKGKHQQAGNHEPPVTPSEVPPDSPTLKRGMEHLPPELLIHLFSFLDGLSLIRMSCVATKYRDIATTVWDPTFKNELEESLLDIAAGIYKGIHRPDRFLSQDVPWKRLYSSLMMWRTVKKWDMTVLVSDHFEDEFCCFKVAGPDALCGTQKGLVYKATRDNLTIGVLALHKSKVNSIVVLFSGENDYDDKKLRYRAVTLSRDRCLQINDIDQMGHSMTFITKLEIMVGVDDRLYEWSEIANDIFVVTIDVQKEVLLSTRHEMKLPSPSIHGRVMAIDPPQSLIITHHSGPMKYDEVSQTWYTMTDCKTPRIFSAFIFPNGVSVSISCGNRMIVSYKDECGIIDWPVTLRPTCALLHGQAFIVGTDRGYLAFYFLESRRDILKISPLDYDAKIHSHQPEGILFLGVSEGDENNPFPAIFAATRRQIIQVRTVGLKR